MKKKSQKKNIQKKKSESKHSNPKSPSSEGATLVKRVLFRPHRSRYVRQEIKTEGCVFCQSAFEGPSRETLCVYQSEWSQIVLNKFPYNGGHLLVLPKSHTGHLLKLSSDEFQDLHETMKKAVQALETVYKPSALNIGLNHGKAAGAGLPDHLHYHVIPRWDGDLNFFPLIAETKAVIESLDQTYEKLFEFFQENVK